MEHNSSHVTPAPVNTADDLIAKIDLITGATRQWTLDDDNELGSAIYRRLTELPQDIAGVYIPEEQRAAVQIKISDLNHAFRRKAIVSLHNLNSLN
jgi:hypothetical protein